MERSMIDLIPILVEIEDAFSRLYKNVALIQGQYNGKIKSAAAVLSRQETDHANYYKELAAQHSNVINIPISEELFVKCRETLSEFRKSIKYESHKDIVALLEYAIDYEKKNGDILREIWACLSVEQHNQEIGLLLTQLIEAETNHSNTLAGFLPK